MEVGEIYFLHDQIFIDFNDPNVMPNKPASQNNISHDRPYCIGYKDPRTNLYWAVPLSSQINKYQNIITTNKNAKIKIYKLLGQHSVFLIQNIIPIVDKYIKNQYIINSNAVKISNKDKENLEKYVKVIINKVHHNKTTLYTDIIRLERFLGY